MEMEGRPALLHRDPDPERRKGPSAHREEIMRERGQPAFTTQRRNRLGSVSAPSGRHPPVFQTGSFARLLQARLRAANFDLLILPSLYTFESCAHRRFEE
jgi:hypothetical protein